MPNLRSVKARRVEEKQGLSIGLFGHQCLFRRLHTPSAGFELCRSARRIAGTNYLNTSWFGNGLQRPPTP